MLSSQDNLITKNLLSFVSLAVALSSFLVSYLNFKRDSGRLDVTIRFVNRLGGIPVQPLPGGLAIKIINSGRRPLIVNSLGAEDRINPIRRFLDSLLGEFLPKFLEPVGVNIYTREVESQLNPNGIAKVLKEGESIDIFMEDPNAATLVRSFIYKYPVFLVHDSMNRRFKCSRRTMRKLKKDLIIYY